MKNNNDMGDTEKSLNDVENESKFIDDKLEGGTVGDELDLHDKLSEGKKYDRPNSNKVQELVAYVPFQSFVFFLKIVCPFGSSAFKDNPHPDENAILKLGKKLSVDKNQVKFWFQNRRNQAKDRQGTVDGVTEEVFQKDSELWKRRVSYYKSVNNQLGQPARYRNILDMNAFLGGFAANLVNDPVWVMNIVPVEAKVNTLGAIYERELIGTYQSWCEAMSTYPRTYDLIHADSVFTLYENR
uniref:Methyltransferase n=1 Tax=Solanum tuberosum TaxID=4113 RepID=M1ACZ2_SOLTU